jgi:hypothetical protein
VLDCHPFVVGLRPGDFVILIGVYDRFMGGAAAVDPPILLCHSDEEWRSDSEQPFQRAAVARGMALLDWLTMADKLMASPFNGGVYAINDGPDSG